MKRRVPRLATDEEAEAFLDSDLSDLDFSQFKSGRLRFEKSARISETYRLFEQAMDQGKQIVCVYEGYYRQLCPIILGHTRGEEKALTYQFDGEGKSDLPSGGQWKCLWLSKVSNVQLIDGPSHSGTMQARPQSCVEVVDLDVNPESPYSPKRRLKNEQERATRVPGRPSRMRRE